MPDGDQAAGGSSARCGWLANADARCFRWDVTGGERRLCPQRKSDIREIVAIMGYVLASWT
jgi:hypothetical protein